jgi:hypothetical protein
VRANRPHGRLLLVHPSSLLPIIRYVRVAGEAGARGLAVVGDRGTATCPSVHGFRGGHVVGPSDRRGRFARRTAIRGGSHPVRCRSSPDVAVGVSRNRASNGPTLTPLSAGRRPGVIPPGRPTADTARLDIGRHERARAQNGVEPTYPVGAVTRGKPRPRLSASAGAHHAPDAPRCPDASTEGARHNTKQRLRLPQSRDSA